MQNIGKMYFVKLLNVYFWHAPGSACDFLLYLICFHVIIKCFLVFGFRTWKFLLFSLSCLIVELLGLLDLSLAVAHTTCTYSFGFAAWCTVHRGPHDGPPSCDPPSNESRLPFIPPPAHVYTKRPLNYFQHSPHKSVVTFSDDQWIELNLFSQWNSIW